MKVESIAECSPLSILQYFWIALSDNLSWKPICGHFESGRLTQVLLYIEALSGKLNIKRRDPGILFIIFISLQACLWRNYRV